MFMSQAASRFRFHRPSVQLRSPFGDDWFGQRAESFARFFGKPRYLLMQTVLVLSWVALNAMGTFHYDPYPFILLNLVFSTQAAYAAPMILLAQTRGRARPRGSAERAFRPRRPVGAAGRRAHRRSSPPRRSGSAAPPRRGGPRAGAPTPPRAEPRADSAATSSSRRSPARRCSRTRCALCSPPARRSSSFSRRTAPSRGSRTRRGSASYVTTSLSRDRSPDVVPAWRRSAPRSRLSPRATCPIWGPPSSS